MLSRASTMLSSEPYSVDANPSALPSRQAALTSYDRENAGELTLPNGAEALDRANAPNGTAVDAEPCS
jgi:hypothetical protein